MDCTQNHHYLVDTSGLCVPPLLQHVGIHPYWAQCMNGTPINDCCHPPEIRGLLLQLLTEGLLTRIDW